MMTRISILLLLAIAGTVALDAQWVLRKSGTSSDLTDVALLDSTSAIAVARNGSVLKTTDAGLTWTDYPFLPLFFHPWNAISFLDSRLGCIVGDGHIVTTTDGGSTWSWHGIPGGGKCLSVLFAGTNSIYVGTDSGWVYLSSDSGATWSGEKITDRPVRSIFGWRGIYARGLAVYALTPQSVWSTRDFPQLGWRETPLDVFNGLGSEAFRGEFADGGGPGFIVGVQGDLRAAPAIIRKKWNDTTWTTMVTEIKRDGTLFGISVPSLKICYVCGDNGMLFKSIDGGDAWKDQSGRTSRRLRAIRFIDENHGFAVGDSGTILYTANGGETAVDAGPVRGPMRYELGQNYPNPFNPTTTISYAIPGGREYGVGSMRTKLVVYDLLGREVAVLVNEVKAPGYYVVPFDGSGLASGVYFYRFEAGGFKDTKRCMLLR